MTRSLVLLLVTAAVSYVLWSPGTDLRDGSHDLGTNGIWLQHGWLGDDGWFERNKRDKSNFRSESRIRALADQLARNHITDVFPHLCPSDRTGQIAPVDHEQVERFLDHTPNLRVMPWVGGVLDSNALPDSTAWRAAFVASVRELLEAHPRLAGIHVNIEPLPSGHEGFLKLLDELRANLPKGKVLSVAAYPPPTAFHPVPEVHWDEAYFRAVASRVDHVAVMMYDTAIRFQKPYRWLMAGWTREVLEWAGDTPVLLGVPAYDDAGTGYHHPHVENLSNALIGIHCGLQSDYPRERPPANYRGIAIYCEWEMDSEEWGLWRERFLRVEPR